MKLTRLRLHGFKSFVEPTDFVIEPGLTGVVGPNGCGKSNLVEALRWAMGETSHKSLRAADMDAVIFAGSGNRPSRNHAEVVMTIDNSDRTAPSAMNIKKRPSHDDLFQFKVEYFGSGGRKSRFRATLAISEEAHPGKAGEHHHPCRSFGNGGRHLRR